MRRCADNHQSLGLRFPGMMIAYIYSMRATALMLAFLLAMNSVSEASLSRKKASSARMIRNLEVLANAAGHLYIKDQRTLFIGYLWRYHQKFMRTALTAAREGLIRKIEFGDVEGPKSLIAMNRIRKLLIGKDIEIVGTVRTLKLRKDWETQGGPKAHLFTKNEDHPTVANPEIWTPKEAADLQTAIKELGLDGLLDSGDKAVDYEFRMTLNGAGSTEMKPVPAEAPVEGGRYRPGSQLRSD